MHVCTCTYTHTYRINTKPTSINTCVKVQHYYKTVRIKYMCVCMCAHIYTHTYTHKLITKPIGVNVCGYAHIFVYVYTCVYAYVYTYTDTYTQNYYKSYRFNTHEVTQTHWVFINCIHSYYIIYATAPRHYITTSFTGQSQILGGGYQKKRMRCWCCKNCGRFYS